MKKILLLSVFIVIAVILSIHLRSGFYCNGSTFYVIDYPGTITVKCSRNGSEFFGSTKFNKSFTAKSGCYSQGFDRELVKKNQIVYGKIIKSTDQYGVEWIYELNH